MKTGGAEVSGGKAAARCREVENLVADAAEAEKLHNCAADGARSDYEGALTSLRCRPVYSMAADTKSFNQRQFFERQLFRRV